MFTHSASAKHCAQRQILLSGFVVLFSFAAASGQTELFAIGGDDRPWAEWGDIVALDTETEPGWIQPARARPDVNLLHDLFAKGRLSANSLPSLNFKPGDGRIWNFHLPSNQQADLLILADGLEDQQSLTLFNRLRSNVGVSFYIDLGMPLPVNEIIFRPLLFGHHQDLFIKGYELLANDGSDETMAACGDPGLGNWWRRGGTCGFNLLDQVATNVDPEVRNSNFTTQYIRFVQIKVTSPQPFEIDQIDIRGDGFVQRGIYTSQIIALPELANFHRIFWSAEEEPNTRITVETRFGTDASTLIYHQINDLGEEVPLTLDTDAANLSTYNQLRVKERGSIIDDTANWTLWSVPYETSGQKLELTGPAQYFQFRVSLETDVETNRVRLDSISLELSSPTQARQVAGEIFPREGVDLGTDQTFTYRLVADIEADNIGFDTIELDTPSLAQLRDVRLGNRRLERDEDYEWVPGETLRVRLLKDRITTSEDTLKLTFDGRILIYGTVFGGRVQASWTEALLPQDIEEKSVGDLTVLGSPASLGKVLSNLSIQPRIFTPNGDGVNDQTQVSFQVAQVIGAAMLEVEIRDLSGRLVVAIFSEDIESNDFVVQWDGRDQTGRLLPPGLYLCRVKLDGDAEEHAEFATVGVAY